MDAEGEGRGSVPRDVIGHDEVARARGRSNHGRGTRGEPTGCQDEHARPFRPHTFHTSRLTAQTEPRHQGEVMRTRRDAATQSAINVIDDENGSTFKALKNSYTQKSVGLSI